MSKRRTEMLERIEQHGRKLLAIFPNITERDPVKLCKKLRQLERKATDLALRQCNGPEWPSEDAMEADYAAVLSKVETVLYGSAQAANTLGVFINRDPRGYALKIPDDEMRKSRIRKVGLAQDWGGYGILAPDLSEE